MLGQDIYIDVDKQEDSVGMEVWKASQNAILPISKDIAEEIKAVLQKCA